LALGDAGFDFSVLCEFRARLLAGGLERLLLEAMLTRNTTWSGDKVQLTETYDADRPHFVVHVETTPEPSADVATTVPIHRALARKDLLPGTHFVNAELLLASETTYGVELIGPVRPNVSWQAKAGADYDISAFAIDWAAFVSYAIVTSLRSRPLRSCLIQSRTAGIQ
jgi:hypothetical protein